MLKMFNYHEGEQNFNDIITLAFELANARHDGKVTSTYSEDVKTLNEAICKNILEGTKYEAKFEAEGLSVLKNPQVTKSAAVRENFNAVIAEIINAVAPAVTSQKYAEKLAEVVQVGWGDTARFIVKSNELFKVNQTAVGVQRGILEVIYDDEYTVNCGPIEIATSINWYQMASGVFDWGDFALRAGRSFEGYIFLKIVAAMTSAITAMGAAYTANGVSTANWTTIADRVRAANGGVGVYGIGTMAALNQAIPSTVGLQYGLGEEVAKGGFLNKYLGVPLMPIDQVIVPGTTNTSATLAVPTNQIFLIAADEYNRPVKVVFEGDTIVSEDIAEKTSDRTYNISLKMMIGVSSILGSKFGTITL